MLAFARNLLPRSSMLADSALCGEEAEFPRDNR
jgi:hypothetical protein